MDGKMDEWGDPRVTAVKEISLKLKLAQYLMKRGSIPLSC